ncbi:MAG: NAD(P)/FAD-dependent oxidoreductase, partial [Sulfurospirillaceae bacterium]|nr:NAD(P)/FAD-dependent oxidoreductase [Sulfurospirillaceae bacterium]
HFLKNWEVKIDGNYGFESAEVMAGGVSLEEIDEKTYESKIVKNLYFSGEVLNVDGDCGGYNLHFAWGSGIIASKAILANA